MVLSPRLDPPGPSRSGGSASSIGPSSPPRPARACLRPRSALPSPSVWAPLSHAANRVQAAWEIAWRKLGSIRDPARLRSWLIAIAANETKTLLKKRHRRSLVEIHGDTEDRSGGVDPAAGVASIDLRALLERLDPEERALLALRYVAGFDATELAAALGISPSGTRTRLERLVARLRQELS